MPNLNIFNLETELKKQASSYSNSDNNNNNFFSFIKNRVSVRTQIQ